MREKRNSRLYLSGIFVSLVGNHFFLISMVYWVKEVHGLSSYVGGFLFCTAITGLVISPFAGVLIDSWQSKKVLILSDILSGILMLLIAGVMYAFPLNQIAIPVILVLTLVISGANSFLGPASLSIISEISSKENTRNLISLRSNIAEISKLGGRSVAGLLLIGVGAPVLVFANGISYLLSAAFETQIKLLSKRESIRPLKADVPFKRRLFEGFQFVKKHNELKWFFIGACLTNFFMAANTTLFPFVIKNVMHFDLWWYGPVMAAFGVGALFGGYLARELGAKVSKRLLPVALLLQGLPYAFTVWASHPLILILILIIVGVFFVFVQVQMIELVNRETPVELKGRVFALMNTLVGALTPAAYILSGVLADLFGGSIIHLYTVSGILIPIIWITVLFQLKSFSETAVVSKI